MYGLAIFWVFVWMWMWNGEPKTTQTQHPLKFRSTDQKILATFAKIMTPEKWRWCKAVIVFES